MGIAWTIFTIFGSRERKREWREFVNMVKYSSFINIWTI